MMRRGYRAQLDGGRTPNMRIRDRLNVALQLAALVCLTPMMAQAEENLGWHGQKDEHGASLFYGIPQTDHAPLSFSCAQGSDELTFAFAFAPINAVDGVKVEVLLEAGDISVPVATTGARIEMDDSFILEGRTVLDARLVDLLTSRGTLSVFVEDGSEASHPLEMTSCHTSKIAGYTIEGHVPVEDIERLIADAPDAIGLAVPGMPMGSPGMEYGDSRNAYDVFLIKKDGATSVF